MKHISLFSGQGGFDLAAEWMGWENVAHCEWNPFGQRILKYYWPNAKSYTDITTTSFHEHRGDCDILTGGFPCQPYSTAGKRLGKEDERHLWPHMLRAIREIRPRWVVGENVRGLVSWNGGLVFDEVQADLENEGYEVLPFLLPACAVNAPHQRERIWFVAYSCDYGSHEPQNRQSNFERNDRGSSGPATTFKFTGCGSSTTGKATAYSENENVRLRIGAEPENSEFRNTCSHDNAANTKGIQDNRWGQERFFTEFTWNIPGFGEFPTQPPVCSGDDGLSTRLDGITFPKWRTESIKAAGNAIVPQVALQIFRSIYEYENR